MVLEFDHYQLSAYPWLSAGLETKFREAVVALLDSVPSEDSTGNFCNIPGTRPVTDASR